jgi:hypothetical protein
MVCEVCRNILRRHQDRIWRGSYELKFTHHKNGKSLYDSAQKSCCICRSLQDGLVAELSKRGTDEMHQDSDVDWPSESETSSVDDAPLPVIRKRTLNDTKGTPNNVTPSELETSSSGNVSFPAEQEHVANEAHQDSGVVAPAEPELMSASEASRPLVQSLLSILCCKTTSASMPKRTSTPTPKTNTTQLLRRSSTPALGENSIPAPRILSSPTFTADIVKLDLETELTLTVHQIETLYRLDIVLQQKEKRVRVKRTFFLETPST